jgi:hypothetical protein
MSRKISYSIKLVNFMEDCEEIDLRAKSFYISVKMDIGLPNVPVCLVV